jgi:hypothetical protein
MGTFLKGKVAQFLIMAVACRSPSYSFNDIVSQAGCTVYTVQMNHTKDNENNKLSANCLEHAAKS